jgi:hypothetical protein
MGLVIGIILLAAGAVLLLGFDRSMSGVELNTIGVILIVLGAVVALASLLSRKRPTTRRAIGETPTPDPRIDAPAEPRADQTWPRPRPPR